MTNNSLALHYAHAAWSNRNPLSLSEEYVWKNLVRDGWILVRLKELMRQEVVRFSYYKNDDTLRIAYGTLRTDLIPEDKRPKDSNNANLCFSRFTYFDLERNEWRSFKINNLLKRGFHVCKPLWVVDYETTLQKVEKEKERTKEK